MARKAAAVIRVGAPGYRAARVLLRAVRENGWSAVGVREADAPQKITLGSVTAAVLQRAVPSK